MTWCLLFYCTLQWVREELNIKGHNQWAHFELLLLLLAFFPFQTLWWEKVNLSLQIHHQKVIQTSWSVFMYERFLDFIARRGRSVPATAKRKVYSILLHKWPHQIKNALQTLDTCYLFTTISIWDRDERYFPCRVQNHSAKPFQIIADRLYSRTNLFCFLKLVTILGLSGPVGVAQQCGEVWQIKLLQLWCHLFLRGGWGSAVPLLEKGKERTEVNRCIRCLH